MGARSRRHSTHCPASELIRPGTVTAQPTHRLTAPPTHRLTAPPKHPNPIEKNQWRRRASPAREAPRVLDCKKGSDHCLRPIGNHHRTMFSSPSNSVSTPSRLLYSFAITGSPFRIPKGAKPIGRRRGAIGVAGSAARRMQPIVALVASLPPRMPRLLSALSGAEYRPAR